MGGALAAGAAARAHRLNPADVVAFFEANWDRKPGVRVPHRSLRELIEKARAPIEKARKDKADYHNDDVWLIVTFKDDFHAFPKIGFVQPYLKPNPKFDNALFFALFTAGRRRRGCDPVDEALRSLEAALKDEPNPTPPRRSEKVDSGRDRNGSQRRVPAGSLADRDARRNRCGLLRRAERRELPEESREGIYPQPALQQGCLPKSHRAKLDREIARRHKIEGPTIVEDVTDLI